jgi:hypothetical protein
MKAKRLAGPLILFLVATALLAATKPFFKPKTGFVPDERTAIAIAVAVWTPVYGAAHIEREKPYRAQLIEGVWHVDGSLPTEAIGGVAHVEIAKEDGRILDMWHSQ